MLFLNLPVSDLVRSKAFYEALGFTINPQYTDDHAACVVMGGGLHCMLHTHTSLRRFTDKIICDPRTSVQMLAAFQVESRDAVDTIVSLALEHGGAEPRPAQDYGFMYYRQFEDPDGNTWEPIWLNPEAQS